MNPTAHALTYRDQSAAERALEDHKFKTMRLITALRIANNEIDSLRLDRIITAAEEDFK